MEYYRRIHRRRSVRLKGYDYARPGSYYVTLNCHLGQHLFGVIQNGVMSLNEFGYIVQSEWLRTPHVRPNVQLGAFIIMPDHLHGIIIITRRSTRKFSPNAPNRHGCNTRYPSGFSGRGGCNTPRPENNLEEGRGVLHPPRSSSHDGNHLDQMSCHGSIPPLISPSQTLGAIIRGFMGTVTSQINHLRNTPGEKVWQRNYYDRIIRNDSAYRAITRYIENNPKNWGRNNH